MTRSQSDRDRVPRQTVLIRGAVRLRFMLCSSMDLPTNPIERAFQIARSGACLGLSDLKLQLKKEGYSLSQIDGRVLNNQLRDLIKKSQAFGG